MCLTAKKLNCGFLFNFGPAAAGPVPPPLPNRTTLLNGGNDENESMYMSACLEAS